VAAKRQWIETPAALTADRARCRAIRAINDALQPRVAAQRARIEQLAAETAHALAAERVLAWREYAFCLYPETLLREFLSGLLPKNA
jgi:hypothetical protein